MKELNEIEKKVFTLVEERGVASSKYNLVADEIIRYCKTKTPNSKQIAKNNYIGNTRSTFKIPESITKKIDFVENLVVNVTITDSKNGMYYSGGGKCVARYSNNIINNKIEYCEIEIYAY